MFDRKNGGAGELAGGERRGIAIKKCGARVKFIVAFF
jgi:hypothetical protein